jgi:hypothetical protein
MNWSNLKYSYGVALIFCGLPIIWIIRDSVGASDSQIYSIVFMVIALCLIVYLPNLWKCIAEVIFPPLTDSYIKLLPLLFLIPALVASFLTSRLNDLGGVYIIFTIAFLIAINSVPYEKLIFLPHAFLCISTIGCLFIMYSTITNGVALEGQRLVAGSTNSPGQVSYTGATAIISGFVLLHHQAKFLGTIFKTFIYISITLGTTVVVLTVSRSTLISLFLCLLVAALNKLLKTSTKTSQDLSFLKHNKKNKKYFIDKLEFQLLIIAVTIILLMLYWELIFEYLSPFFKILSIYQEKFIDYLKNGYQTYIGASSKEASAAIRRNNLHYALVNMNNWGYGYKALWVDFPLVQGFYDGGLIGGFLFLITSAIMPLFFVMRMLYQQKVDVIKSTCIYIYILAFPGLFLHGQPYDFYIWFRIILTCSIMSKVLIFQPKNNLLSYE